MLKRINHILVRLSQNLRYFELFIPLLELAEPPSNLHYDMAVLARMRTSSPRTNRVHQRTLSPKASEYRDIYDFNLKVVYNSKTPLSASPNLLIASITSSSSAIANVARKNISDCWSLWDWPWAIKSCSAARGIVALTAGARKKELLIKSTPCVIFAWNISSSMVANPFSLACGCTVQWILIQCFPSKCQFLWNNGESWDVRLYRRPRTGGKQQKLTNMPAAGSVQDATSIGKYFSQAWQMLSRRRVYSILI